MSQPNKEISGEIEKWFLNRCRSYCENSAHILILIFGISYRPIFS